MCGNPVPPGAEACPNDGNTLFVGAGQVPESLIGMQLGEYVVKERLGEGGMSDVYAGLQPVIMKRVAIKVLKPEMAADKTQVQRLMTEAQAVNSIGHRNIIDIFSSGTLPDGRAYVVMEFLDGEPLDVYLRRVGPLPPLEAIELLIDVCTPLVAAHAKGIIHRDLKPSNVFLVNQPDGTRFLKLLDFGLAKQSMSIDGKTSQTSVHQISGTPDYMAPEQARGEDVSPLTDLYALGVMGFQLLTNQLPFVGKTPMDVMMMHVSNIPPQPGALVAGVPPALEQLVLQLLEKDPARRPPTAEIVRAELKHIGLALRSPNAVATRMWTGEQPAYVPNAPPSATPVPMPPPLGPAPNTSPGMVPMLGPAPNTSPGMVPLLGPAPNTSPGMIPPLPVPPLAGGPMAIGAEAAAPPAHRHVPPAVWVGAGLALVAAAGLFIWSRSAPPPVAEVVPPPPPLPVVVAPVPPPVEVEHPAVPDHPATPVAAAVPEPHGKEDSHLPKKKLRPAHDVPTTEELHRRLAKLEQKLRDITPKGAEPDPTKLNFIAREKVKLSMATTVEDRREVAHRLDALEAQLLKK